MEWFCVGWLGGKGQWDSMKPQQRAMDREQIWDWTVAGEERYICQLVKCFGDVDNRLEVAYDRNMNLQLRHGALDIFINPTSSFCTKNTCICFANILFKNFESVVKSRGSETSLSGLTLGTVHILSVGLWRLVTITLLEVSLFVTRGQSYSWCHRLVKRRIYTCTSLLKGWLKILSYDCH